MKALIGFILFTISLNVFACPSLVGTFFDDDSGANRTIIQNGCVSTTWSDEDGVTTLLADNVERVLQSEDGITAYAKVSFTKDDLIIDIRIDYGGKNEYDLPVRWLTSYRIDKSNNLVEKIEPFAADGSQGDTDYVTYKRVK
jgi:hypothetical protein